MSRVQLPLESSSVECQSLAGPGLVWPGRKHYAFARAGLTLARAPSRACMRRWATNGAGSDDARKFNLSRLATRHGWPTSQRVAVGAEESSDEEDDE